MKVKPNIQCASKMLFHFTPPELNWYCHRTSVKTLLEGTVFLHDIVTGVLMVVVESTV